MSVVTARPVSQPGAALHKALGYASDIRRQLRLRFHLANAVCGLLPDFGSGVLRARLYRRLVGLDIGPGAWIMGNIELSGGAVDCYEKIHIGAGASIGPHVTINADAEVRLGDNVSLGPFVRIYTGTHAIGPGSNRRMGATLARPVIIENGCWIALGAMILPGVTVGHGSVVAAGAVVDSDVPPDSYVVGNPARVAQKLPWGHR